MTLTANEVFRDFVTDGVPSSGAWKPLKKEIRALLAAMATGGATGLYDFIPASNTGAGTANALKADTAVALPATPNGALLAVNIYTDNTASPVTVQFNGGTVYTIKTNSGNDVAPGGLKAGMVAAGYISGSTFRLLSDQASAAIQAAAEAAQAAAEAAALNAAVYDPTTRYPTPGLLFASTRGPAGEGSVWIGGNFAYREAASDATDHDFENAAGVKFYFDEPEADPLAFPPTIGTDDTANFAHALEYAEKITLDPRHEYKIHDMLLVERPVILDWNGAKVVAASGFTDPQLMKITASEVRFERSGVLDGTNLPGMSGDFIGADFTGITLYALGTSGAPLADIDLGDLKIISGECGAFYATYCPDIRILGLRADGVNQHATFDVAAPISLNYCDRAQLGALKVKNAKQKGISVSNSDNWQGGLFSAHSTHSGHAAVFVVGSNKWIIDNVLTRGGFGVKTDNTLNGYIGSVDIDCSSVGLGGLMIQGCQLTAVGGGLIRGFTDYGVAVTWHGSKNLAVTNTTLSDLDIIGSATKGDGSSAVALLADTTYGCYGTKLRNVRMNGVDIGLNCRFDAGNVLINDVELDGVTGTNIKSFFAKGVAQSLRVKGGGISGSIGIDDVFRVWSGIDGSVLSFNGFEVREISTTARFLAVSSGYGRSQYDQIVVNGVVQNGGAALAYITLDTTSDRVKTLQIQNSSAFGISGARGIELSSASDTTVQVNIAGNSLLDSAGAKQNIYFNNAAKFNGVVANNMATPVNTPGNV